MSKYFSYEAKIELNNGKKKFYRVLFSSHSAFNRDELQSILTKIGKEELEVDAIIFIVPKYDLENYSGCLKDQLSELKRVVDPKNAYLFCYTEDGKLTKEVPIGNDSTQKHIENIAEEHIENIVYTQGKIALLEQTVPVEKAPHGYVYEKPSKKRSKTFLRASNLLVKEKYISFIAFCLLPYFEKNPIKIYIDTSSIRSLILNVVYFKNLFREKNNFYKPNIESFHSYEGFKENLDDNIPGIKIEYEGSTLIFISASNTGNLEQEIEKYLRSKNFSKEYRIVPILAPYVKHTKNEEKSENQNEFAVDMHFQHLNFKAEADGEYEEQDIIKLGYEDFIVKSNFPTRLILSSGHAPKFIRELMPKIVGKKLFGHLFSKNTGEDLFYFNDSLIECGEFQTWNRKFVDVNIPLNVSTIIHSADLLSERLAENLQACIECKMKGEIAKIKDSESLEKEKLDPGTIIIVSCVVRTGNTILNIIRRIRDSICDEEHYIYYYLPVTVNKNYEEFKNLEKTIKVRNNQRVDDNIHIWQGFTIGNKANSSWKKEKEEIDKIIRDQEIDKIAREKLNERLEYLKKAEGSESNSIFLLNGVRDTKLKLKKHFVFWELETVTNYQENDVEIEVLLTMANVLQYARDGETHKKVTLDKDKSKLLKNNHANTTILSAQNFTRFNDSVIQASLLRLAKTSELNYSLINPESDLMRQNIISIIDAYKESRGGAATEFLFALYTGKLLLFDSDYKKIKERIKELILSGVDKDEYPLFYLFATLVVGEIKDRSLPELDEPF